ncbi:MAG TPA: S-layer homology domain-containing protein, partial [Chloroflexia bacterium]|nr:S-layer homology domain-containing protein [Chloroflexia bacterium]
SDAWAVGGYEDGTVYQTLTQHWDGTAWTVVPSPNPGSSDNTLLGVAAVSAGDVWAVGWSHDPYTAAYVSLIEHWNGSDWMVVDRVSTSGPTGLNRSFLEALAVVSHADVWAVGSMRFPRTGTAWTEHYTTQFTDVPTSNPFYNYISCLACRGIVSGYTTDPPCTTGVPCFQPGANVTRGQMAKFVSNAASYSDAVPSTQQTFTDVPSSDPFWLYVERTVLHGVISGYSSNPPCRTGVPCFLGGNAVTRGQTAKFISNGFFPSCPVPGRVAP